MNQLSLIRILYLLFLGSSSFVWGAPMLGAEEKEKSKSRSRSRTPAPDVKGDQYPLLTANEVNDICQEIETPVLDIIDHYDKNHKRMPDERTLTETLVMHLEKNGAGKATFHTQNEEGSSGTDFYIQVSFSEDEVDDLTKKFSRQAVDESNRGRPRRRGAGRGAGSAEPAPQIPAPQPEQVAAAAAAAAAPQKFIVILQAKSYHANKDASKSDHKAGSGPQMGEPDRVAKFTYQSGKNADGPLQMDLLDKYAKEQQQKNPNVHVIAGYLLYAPEGIAFVPLADIMDMCHKENNGPCTKADDKVDKQLSYHFQHEYKQTHKCFLEQMIRATPHGK
ncbi:hypothetical protein FS842_000968 [Serendipita sp. 407]|nr:hypothetical protein FS842_000968 [Serendipita sp. 407]